MAFAIGATDPFKVSVSKPNPYAEYVNSRIEGDAILGQTQATGWTFDPLTDLAELVTGGITSPAPVYQDEIMRIANGQQPHPEQYMSTMPTAQSDGTEFFAGAMDLMGALIDANMGAPTEHVAPLVTPAFWGGQKKQSGFDVQTLALFAGGAMLVYLLAKAA